MPLTYLPHTCHHQLPYFFSSPSLSTLKHFNPHIHFLNNNHPSPMAERNNPTHQQQQQRPSRANRTVVPSSTFLQKIQSHAPNTTHFLGFLLLFFVSATTLLILTGLTLTATVFGLLFFMPLVIVSSPVWFPICTLLFLTAVGFLSACSFGVAVAAGSTWMYRYFRGMHPPGSDRFDSARTRIYDTASHVKDYAMEYGGYLQSKVKDAAPGA